MTDLIRDFWHIILSALAVIVFIVRMEGRTALHGHEIDRLQRQRDHDQESAQRSRDETHTMLREVNSKLDRLIERNMK